MDKRWMGLVPGAVSGRGRLGSDSPPASSSPTPRVHACMRGPHRRDARARHGPLFPTFFLQCGCGLRLFPVTVRPCTWDQLGFLRGEGKAASYASVLLGRVGCGAGRPERSFKRWTRPEGIVGVLCWGPALRLVLAARASSKDGRVVSARDRNAAAWRYRTEGIGDCRVY
jgi:hypothetical protein